MSDVSYLRRSAGTTRLFLPGTPVPRFVRDGSTGGRVDELQQPCEDIAPEE